MARSEEEMGPLTGSYELRELMVERGELPAGVTMEVKQGNLNSTSPGAGCTSLIPLTATRFAIAEQPGMALEFDLVGDRVEKASVYVGMIVAVYGPRE